MALRRRRVGLPREHPSDLPHSVEAHELRGGGVIAVTGLLDHDDLSLGTSSNLGKVRHHEDLAIHRNRCQGVSKHEGRRPTDPCVNLIEDHARRTVRNRQPKPEHESRELTS